jgi:hypothetical protein
VRLLVAGSRTWTDRDRLWQILGTLSGELARVHKDRFVKEGLTLVSGHARSGADVLAEEWFADRFPLESPELWPADWKKIGRRAGIVRNTAMVDSGPDLCVAFIMPCDKDACVIKNPHGSHGTVHCSDYAERRGVLTTRYYGGVVA